MDFFDLLKLILASFGGAAVALLGLSKWLGNVWANRILEGEKAKHNLELEERKSQLGLEANKSVRYIESQFSLYNSLWEALYNLKIAGDSLWEEASLQNLKRFASQLTQAEEMIHQRSLLIEENHQRELVSLIKAFDNFRIGKERLIKLRKGSYIRLTDSDSEYVNRQIQNAIEQNRHIRDQYNDVITEVQRSLRNQLRGSMPPHNNAMQPTAK